VTALHVGTRGSDLALRQTGWVCDRLREAHPSLVVEQVIIKTHGDLVPDQHFGPAWPEGAFVTALEHALLEQRIDVAVHSYKDLPTALTEGLDIAAIPIREAPHDVLLTRTATRLTDLPAGARIGTNSPRRAAQIRRLRAVEIVPIRGNVPTRIAKLEREGLDGVILAAAGLNRLGIDHPHRIDLPPEQFLPAPAQGALAVQVRAGSATARLVAAIDDPATRRTVTAERSLLREIGAGCHAPVGALATVRADLVSLRGRLFSDDQTRDVTGTETGPGPEEVGVRLARRMLAELGARDS
jgi:hydroxymethylbilane synthase